MDVTFWKNKYPLKWTKLNSIFRYSRYKSYSVHVPNRGLWFIGGNYWTSYPTAMFNMTSGTASAGPDLSQINNIEFPCAVQLNDSATLIAGGFIYQWPTQPFHVYIDKTWMYDWDSENLITMDAKLNTGRSQHTCGLYKSSKMVIHGGLALSRWLYTTEYLDLDLADSNPPQQMRWIAPTVNIYGVYPKILQVGQDLYLNSFFGVKGSVYKFNETYWEKLEQMEFDYRIESAMSISTNFFPHCNFD